ncbi:MAG: DNA recombination protein RmuC [Bacteroidia bacterium]
MNLDVAALIIGMASGGILAWIISSMLNKNADNQRQMELALESEKLRAANDSLYKTQEVLIEKTKELNQIADEASGHKARLDSAIETFRKQESEANDLKKELTEKHNLITEHYGKIQELKSQNDGLNDKLKTLRQEIDETRKTFETEFKNMAQTILDEKTQKFTELNKTNMDSILKPLSENIENFKKKVEETYDKESKERFSLGEKVKDLVTLNEKISKEANDLTKALKGDSKKQGNWGEVILERILEKSGLEKGREYSTQESYRDEHGNIFRPDVVLTYPDDRKVVIDSKVSLVAYEKYASSEDVDEQKIFLKEHIRSLRNHIDALSLKKYDELVKSLDFTMMFIPIEPAYLEAVRDDEDLWHYAYNKRILLISPTHLVSAIKMIADLWKREFQNRNAEEIAKRGGLLYDKFVGFVENLEKVGKNIGQAGKAYDEAFSQLKEGRGNLLNQAESLRKLGIKNTKDISTSVFKDMPTEEAEE